MNENIPVGGEVFQTFATARRYNVSRFVVFEWSVNGYDVAPHTDVGSGSEDLTSESS